jgi:hypothetical protein
LTTKISDSAEGFLDKNKMAMNVAGAVLAVSKMKKKSDSKSKKKKSSKSDVEFE